MASINVLYKARIFSRLLSYLGNLSIALMMLLTTVDVLGRYFFNHPVLGAYEITEYLMLILVFSFLAFAQSMKAHISVDIVFDRLPGKMKWILERFNHLVCLVMMIFVTRMGVYRVFDLKESGSESMLLKIPDYLFGLFMVFGCLIFCIEFFIDVFGTERTDEEDSAS